MRRLLGFAVLALGAAPAAAQRDPRLARLDAYIEKTRAEWKAPAVAVAIVRNDSVIFAKGYGVLEAGKSTKADENTIFAIGSSSKAFTTASLAMLVDEGKLKWDDPAAGYLPGWQLSDPWVTREITIKDLITHRVGLDRADLIWEGTDFSRAEVFRRQRFIKPQSSFRYRFGYNNHMFLAAGEVIEHLTGKSWDDFVRERIFEPLGMRRTVSSTRPLSGMTNVATPHGWLGDSVVPIPWHNLDNMAPAGSINSSVRDMAEWVRLQLGDGVYRGRRLVSAAAMKAMHSPQMVVPIERWYASMSPVNHQMVPGTHVFLYGLGWFLQDYKGRYIIQHGGSIDGMRALVMLVPDEKLGLVALTNQNPSNVDEAIMFRVLDEYLGGSVTDWGKVMLDSMTALRRRDDEAIRKAEAARVPNTHPSLPLAQYAGTYADSAYGTAVVEERGGTLALRVGILNGTLEHWHFDTFVVHWNTPTKDRALVTFELNARGQATKIILPGLAEFQRSQ